MTMTTQPLATVKAHLSEYVRRATTQHERTDITVNGERQAVLLGADDFDSLQETLAILADDETRAAIAEGLADIAARRTFSLEQIKADVAARRAAGELE